MRPLATRFNGEKWIMFGTHNHEFQGYIKGWLIGLSLKFAKAETLTPIKLGFYRFKKMYCINNRVMFDDRGLFIYLIMGILAFAMMWPFCANQTCTKINVNFLWINMIISSTYLGTLVIWARKCLWCNNLGSMNLPLDMT